MTYAYLDTLSSNSLRQYELKFKLLRESKPRKFNHKRNFQITKPKFQL